MNRKSFFDRYVMLATPALTPTGIDLKKLQMNEDKILQNDVVWKEMEEVGITKSAIALDIEMPKEAKLMRRLFWKGIQKVAAELGAALEEPEPDGYNTETDDSDTATELSSMRKDTSRWNKPY